MVIFVNDIPVRIWKPSASPEPGHVNHVIDISQEPVAPANLIHHLFVRNAGESDLDMLLGLLDSRVPINLFSLDVSVNDYEKTKQYLRQRYQVLKAAGGLVRKKGKYLMIYRLKKWDLPKGKKEKKETYKETAIREVEEECRITVKLGSKICTTWHTYTMNKKNMLKKTRWYIMDIDDDSRMEPRRDEDIEDLRWMSPKEVYHALEHSYRSIRHVFECYFKMSEVPSAE